MLTKGMFGLQIFSFDTSMCLSSLQTTQQQKSTPGLPLQADLLPKGTDLSAVTDWLLDIAAFRRLRVVNAFLVGSPKGQGLDQVASAMLRERRGRDVYVLGAANVGKSSFVRALMRSGNFHFVCNAFSPPGKSIYKA